MSAATISRDSAAPASPPPLNCRVFERHPSELPTQCQPLAARGDDEIVWQSTVHDISAGGIGLLLQRRFEPRTSLAIELPDGGDSTYTVFVRVIHALGQPNGRWLLGCSFVTPLSEERLSALLLASGKQPRPKSPPPAETTKLPEVAVPEVTKPEVAKPEVAKPEVAKPEVAKPEVGKPEVAVKRKHSVIQDVCFRANLPDGNVLSRSVTRLHMTGTWPMTAGRIVSVWVGNGKKNRTAVKLRVNDCYEEDGRWVVDCSFVKAPPTELVSRMNKKRLPQPQ